MKTEYYWMYCGACRDQTIHYGENSECIRCEKQKREEEKGDKMLIMSNKNLKFSVKVDDDNVFPFTIEFKGDDFVMSKFYGKKEMYEVHSEIERALHKHEANSVND